MTFRACLRWTAGLAVAVLIVGVSSWPAQSAQSGMPSATATPAAQPQAGAILGTVDGQPRLLVDGKPFFFFGGAFFYPRISPENWRTSMEAMRSLGANTLDLYMPWNWHELSDGEFDFDGHTDPRRNLREVLRLGAELGFHFIIRPGPVIRNEWRNGGYPAWLLERPEYDMPLHDILEGRYPATATLQNAHSDDAAAEWMNNQTHLTYSARWIARALAECKPYASRILAVQLDDDEGAYIDNQTYPAPHLTAYLQLLNDRVHAALGPQMPTFINTYQMRVPSAAAVWTMGNWYQSDAYTIGEHDRVDLDFSTLLLALNRRGPLAQSEFQAGWLAGPEDPDPRPADPRNTALALSEMLSLGVQGVVDFPLQDTLAEPGWEAPFSNALYAWDAALPLASYAGSIPEELSRFAPTRDFGTIALRLGPTLARMRRVPNVGIVYAHAPARNDGMPSVDDAGIVAAVRDALSACDLHGIVCDLVDEFTTREKLRMYRLVVIPSPIVSAAPSIVSRIRTTARSVAVPVAATIGTLKGDGITTLTGPLGTLRIASNWTDHEETVTFGHSRVALQPHSVTMRVANLDLSALGDGQSHGRVTSDDCALAPDGLTLADGAQGLGFAAPLGGCSIEVFAKHHRIVRIPSLGVVSLPKLQLRDDSKIRFLPVGSYAPLLVRIAPYTEIAAQIDRAFAPSRVSVDLRTELPDMGSSMYDFRNDRLRVVVDGNAGGRAFDLQPLTPVSGLAVEGTNAFDATGALRDDVATPLPPSPRDYIARYTHQYPAGTFNRTYTAVDQSTPTRASVLFRYTMPDADPANLTFEKVVSLDAASSRVVVDERAVAPNAAAKMQPIVVRSSLPLLFNLQPAMQIPDALVPTACAPTCTLPPQQRSVAAYRDGTVFVVAWADGAIASATWTPYRSTGTLALTMTPGAWHRVVYAYAAAPSLDAARAFVEAERAWVSANPPPSP
jgi:hypothetical protein